MKLKDFVESGLRAGGFDGLCNSDGGCSCRLGDLFPCGEPSGDECKAGYAGRCDGSCDDPPCDGHVYATLADAAASRGQQRVVTAEVRL